ncbi:tyrosine-protein kinase TXK-like [Asterias amurensis]|uniref:tyrosine-protein kinase TXK-like n=1 Tax=Asterias amurensis TaxID=7602 RepID=UPI003AB35A31
MADDIEGIIRIGFMLKRSQNKRKLAPVNYKSRVFILTQNELIYFEGTLEKRGKEKSRINLSEVKIVEEVDFNALEKQFGIQISYEDYTLYFFASSKKEQKEWLSDLQIACKNNVSLLNKFHTGAHNCKAWTCCDQKHVGAPGCKDTFKHKITHSAPVPPSPRMTTNGTGSLPPHRQTTPPNNGPLVPNRIRGHHTAPGLGKMSLQHEHHHNSSGERKVIPLPKLPKLPEVVKKPNLIVIAKFDYDPMEEMDIRLIRGDEYHVIDNSREYWWKARNKKGEEGYIPSNYVEEKSKFSSGLEKYEWFTGSWNRQRTEEELRAEGKDGCFMVRNSSTKGLYTLSVLTKGSGPVHEDNISHYHIKQNADNQNYVSEKHCFHSIPDLINYHQHNAGGLITRLRNPPGHIPPTTAGLGSRTLVIDWKELRIHRELGSGQFGVVKLAKINKRNQFVAVKIMRENAMSEDDFVDEAKVMTQFQHENLVQLYGVCKKPICIITEYMSKGCLLFHLRRHKDLLQKPTILLHMAVQICSALFYLETKKFIHRDLAARNCLVGERNVVKVADFGLTRYVLDDEYTSTGTKFPIKWAPPEVLHYTKFSSKSDVWAYGILLWEIFSGGQTPYPKMNNVEVVDQVTRKQYRMEQPPCCPRDIYCIMYRCWQEKPEQRPSFGDLMSMVTQLQDQESTNFIE